MADARKPVLTIGVAGHAGMTPEQMQVATRQMADLASQKGFDFHAIFISPYFSDKERLNLRETLKQTNWVVVAIGSGLRLPEDRTKLLEDVVNTVLTTVRPVPRLMFPTKPEEMLPGFERVLEF